MAAKVKVLQKIAGSSYGWADPGDLMMWPEGSDLDSMVERKLVEVIGKERGGNTNKPYLLNRVNPNVAGPVHTKITAERAETNILKWQ